jgi:hypothetical protein
MARLEDTFTFVGATEQGRAVFMDIAALTGEREALAHCQALLASHDSGDCIEIWRGAALVATVARTIAPPKDDRAPDVVVYPGLRLRATSRSKASPPRRGG